MLAVVIPDEPPESRAKIRDLRGRELPGVPGSWVTRVAIHDPHADPPRNVLQRDGQARGSGGPSTPDDGAAPAPGAFSADELEHELDLDSGETTPDA